MDKLPELSALVAKDLHGAERAITTAVRDTALMAHTLSSVLLSLPVSADVCHGALSEAIASLDMLREARERLVKKAHPDLTRWAKRLGLQETDWGGGYPKEDSVFTVPSASIDGVPVTAAIES